MKLCETCTNEPSGPRARYCERCARERENARKRRKYVRGAFEDAVFDACGERCSYCLVPHPRSSLRLDHVVPLADGGTNSALNLVPACDACNSEKSDKPLLVFLLDRRIKSLAQTRVAR